MQQAQRHAESASARDFVIALIRLDDAEQPAI
jgi:hypothetical protein